MPNSAGSRVAFANSLRGFAALSVIISHYYGVFWKEPAAVSALLHVPALPNANLSVPIYIHVLQFSSLFNWGPFGVALFFLISGFVIPSALQKTTAAQFVITRMFRILPTYAVGLAVSLGVIYLGGWYFEHPFPFQAEEIFVHFIPGIRDILGTTNIDGIIWTLEIEVKFYLICLLIKPWFNTKSLKVFLIPVGLCVLSWMMGRLLHKVPDDCPQMHRLMLVAIYAAPYLVFMFIGVAFHYLYHKIISAEKALVVMAGLFLMFLLLWRVGPYQSLLPIMWNYGFALFLFVVAYTHPAKFAGNRLSDFLSEISYPLYVFHAITGYMALRILIDKGCPAWLALSVVTTAILLLSWLVSQFIERPALRLGKSIAKQWLQWWPAPRQSAQASLAN